MARHTPRPWRIEDGTTLIWGNCDPDDLGSYGMGYPVADCQHPRSWRRDRPTEEEIDGNARLIAAAPEMLAALKGAMHALRSYQYGNAATESAEEIADACEVIIAKAEAA